MANELYIDDVKLTGLTPANITSLYVLLGNIATAGHTQMLYLPTTDPDGNAKTQFFVVGPSTRVHGEVNYVPGDELSELFFAGNARKLSDIYERYAEKRSLIASQFDDFASSFELSDVEDEELEEAIAESKRLIKKSKKIQKRAQRTLDEFDD